MRCTGVEGYLKPHALPARSARTLCRHALRVTRASPIATPVEIGVVERTLPLLCEVVPVVAGGSTAPWTPAFPTSVHL